ncbi:hypothetical protein HMPREF1531_02187 [Propionibacterium sp. oral taxon 192 str. F0372]|uniref:HRDC domain-containing protein n=1 Tax=Propionibacterium sp. oral taxon 192 TaxID=671222 RepID=UPI000352B6EC|nr:HRDC domain-containing protein [Propionibacterium sp. oral taxon 192]EPH02871.1 hypothetical protein HMPREF1531_02187 [Propionibacterium sp. oral taxon 192 str. F0372]
MTVDAASGLPTLTKPADGVPDVTDNPHTWRVTLNELANGSGPIAIDVERAQGYRYLSKAYLLQLKRHGAGIHLVDPVALEGPGEAVADLTELQEIIGDQEWILHAATQDLPNLVELGLRPSKLFDTELAGRLLGLERVGLGSMVEAYCGVHLLKEHSAVDWSRRPMPEDWLAYAALDVELLHELRDHLLTELINTGKQRWAREEFDHLCRCALTERPARPDPWRKTSGCHQVRSRRGLALVKQLWTVRERIAERTDTAHGKILHDKAITELASMITRSHPEVPGVAALRRIDGFKRRRARANEQAWLEAMDEVADMPEADLPPMKRPSEGVPMPRNWERLRPEAHQRWEAVRPAIVTLAEELRLPVENLISPDSLRQVLWAPESTEDAGIATQLEGLDVRAWQRELVVPIILAGIS